jgi:sigma-B regulation protein RsbU (phosphoserine phosphatase)
MDGLKFKEHEFELNKGDCLFVYTDGVTEATNSNNELYGNDRLLNALNTNKDRDMHELLPAVKADIDEFVGNAPQFDDITMLGFIFNGTEGNEMREEKAQNYEELRVDASVDKLDTVLMFIDERLEKIDCPPKFQMQIDVAVEELFVNIAHYAYEEGNGFALIRFSVCDDGSEVAITFVDEGIPYNPLEKPDPDTSLAAEEREIGGLGIYMVKKSMDGMEYEYKDRRNVLTIKKKIAII